MMDLIEMLEQRIAKECIMLQIFVRSLGIRKVAEDLVERATHPAYLDDIRHDPCSKLDG